ncbi:hypothetical protein LG302_16705 [Halomonas organivorans]
MTPMLAMPSRQPQTATEAGVACGNERVFGVCFYWPGYWFSAGVPAARS